MTRQYLTLVTPPGSEPVTLAAAKEWAKVDGTDDDATITGLIAAARCAAEEYLRRSLITQSWKLTLDLPSGGADRWLGEGVYNLPVSVLHGNLCKSIVLPKAPIQSITSVVSYDTSNTATTFDPGNYRVDAAGERLVLNSGATWPSSIRPASGVEITYVAGYGEAAAVPQPIKTGILIHLAALYEQRGLCEDAMALPPGTEQLYRPYRIVGDRLG